MSVRPDPFVCPKCGTRFVVPSMATDCAARHPEGDT